MTQTDKANPPNLNRYSFSLNNPVRYVDPSGHRICDDVDAYGNCITYDGGDDEENLEGNNDNGGDGEDTDGEEMGDVSEAGEGMEKNPVYALVTIGLFLHVATVVTEVGVVWGEAALAPLTPANPLVVVPLELMLAAAGLAVLDLDIAYWSYTYRVYTNPQEHQDFQILPPWGFSE